MDQVGVLEEVAPDKQLIVQAAAIHKVDLHCLQYMPDADLKPDNGASLFFAKMPFYI
jgi:hypothetical protein